MALLVEVYRELGMKFTETIEELEKRLGDPAAPARRKPEPDNQASLAVLQAMMGGSDFSGAKG